MDIGTLEKYLQAHLDILQGHTPFSPKGLKRRSGFWLAPRVYLGRALTLDGHNTNIVIGHGAKVGNYVRFGGNICIGPNCKIGQGATLENCVVLKGTRIGEGARLEGCIIGQNCVIGPHTTVSRGRAVGDRSVIMKFSQL